VGPCQKVSIGLEIKDGVNFLTVRERVSEGRLFSRVIRGILLYLDNDQLMSEKQNNSGGGKVLASEIKCIGNVVVLEGLVM